MAKYVEEEIFTSELLPSPVACVNELFPSSTADDQNDLILAAELGKALLERNRGLEARIAQLQLTLEDADKENASFHRQLVEARQKIRTYEELDLRNSELERECDRLRDALTKEKLNADRIAQRIRELEHESDSETIVHTTQHEQPKCPDCMLKAKHETEVSETLKICNVSTQTDLRWLMEPIANREDRVVQHESELDSAAVREALEALTAAHKENKALRESLANALEAQRELERRNAALRDELFEREDRLRVENFLVIGSDSQVHISPENDAVSTVESKAKVKANQVEASRSSLKSASTSSTKQKRVLARLEAKYSHMIAKYDSLLFDLRTRAGATVSRSATLPNLLHVGTSTNVNANLTQIKHMDPIEDAEDDQSEQEVHSNRESVELSTEQNENSQVEPETTCEGGEPQYRRLFRDLYDLIHRSLNESASQAVRSAAEHCQNLVDVRFDPAELDIDPNEWDDIGEYVSG